MSDRDAEVQCPTETQKSVMALFENIIMTHDRLKELMPASLDSPFNWAISHHGICSQLLMNGEIGHLDRLYHLAKVWEQSRLYHDKAERPSSKPGSQEGHKLHYDSLEAQLKLASDAFTDGLPADYKSNWPHHFDGILKTIELAFFRYVFEPDL